MVGRVFLSTFPKASRVRLHRAQGRCLQSGPVTETGRERLNSQDVFEVETVILRTKKHQGAFGGGVNVCTQPKMGERALLLALLPHPPPPAPLSHLPARRRRGGGVRHCWRCRGGEGKRCSPNPAGVPEHGPSRDGCRGERAVGESGKPRARLGWKETLPLPFSMLFSEARCNCDE